MKIEIRAEGAVIEGYVNAVDRDSRVIPTPMGGFVERVVPKTFARALAKGNDIRLKFNHGRVIGSVSAGTLELKEDNIGLYAKAVVSDKEVIDKARRGELRGWSFGFYKDRDRMEDIENGLKRRYLEEIELNEVSIISNGPLSPIYPATSIEMRGEEETMSEMRGMEDIPEVMDFTTDEQPDYTKLHNEIDLLRKRYGK